DRLPRRQLPLPAHRRRPRLIGRVTRESTMTTGTACPQWTTGGAAGLPAGPFGLGTSAARIASQFAPAPGQDPAYAHLPWGDGSAPPLYCPVVGRVDNALAGEVDRRLVAWAADCGFTGEGLEQIAHAGFGRLVMLAHPDCDDPDRL